MLNMIDIPVERRLLLAWTHEHGIDPDDAAPFTNHPDLFVTRIAFDVVIPPRIAVGHDERSRRERENLIEAHRVNVGEINHHAERFTGLNQVAPKAGQTI